MTLHANRIDQLIAFRQRDKFSDKAWNKRGLNPSGWEISSRLTELFNQCADALIDAVGRDVSNKQLKAILKFHLANFRGSNYDTEEKEFICDTFYELAQIVGVDFAYNLNCWLYGYALTVLQRIQTAFKRKEILDTIKQTCPTCVGAIDTFIMRREEGIPDYAWNIVQCKNCKDYSLVSYGPNVKEVKFGNYEMIEQLPKENFTKEQADIRVEQLRYFR